MELVASFHECKHCAPWPLCGLRAVAGCGAVRTIRGTPRQRGGWNAHDHCMFCSSTPEMYEPHRHAFSPHIARGYTDQQNSQPVILKCVSLNSARRVTSPAGLQNRACNFRRTRLLGGMALAMSTSSRGWFILYNVSSFPMNQIVADEVQ